MSGLGDVRRRYVSHLGTVMGTITAGRDMAVFVILVTFVTTEYFCQAWRFKVGG